MIEKIFSKAVLLGVIFLFVFVVGQFALAGQNNNNNPTPPELLIAEVWVDFNNNEIKIIGVNLDNGHMPFVTLGDDSTPLVLNSYAATEIVVVLPAVPDGDYLLAVSTGPAVKNYDEYDLTIGAVGPQGLQGEQGPPGPPGVLGFYTRHADNCNDAIQTCYTYAEPKCDSGDKVTGGGWTATGAHASELLLISRDGPTSDGRGWRVDAYSSDGHLDEEDLVLNVYAICVDLTP